MNLKEKLQIPLRFLQSRNYFNKYYIAIFGFVIWLSFFDRYNFVTQFKLSQNVQELQDQRAEYEEQLAKALVEWKTINSNIEKYGRAKYYFHKPNEKVILIK